MQLAMANNKYDQKIQTAIKVEMKPQSAAKQ